MDKLLQLGDICVTRNSPEDGNPTLGYWNHGSVFIGKGIVEARQKYNSVVLSEFDEFWERYPQISVMRWTHKVDVENVGEKASRSAELLIGKPYLYISSIIPAVVGLFTDLGENCVSVPRHAYANTLGFDPGWHIPDNIVFDRRLMRVLLKGDVESQEV